MHHFSCHHTERIVKAQSIWKKKKRKKKRKDNTNWKFMVILTTGKNITIFNIKIFKTIKKKKDEVKFSNFCSIIIVTFASI